MNYADKFQEFFQTPFGQKAGGPLKDGTEIEFKIYPKEVDPESPAAETFTFFRLKKENQVRPSAASKADLTFFLTVAGADSILNHPDKEIGPLGVLIAKLIVTNDPKIKIQLKLHTGFLALLKNGYFGVIRKGGKEFTQFLATKGLDGMGSFKTVVNKLRGK